MLKSIMLFVFILPVDSEYITLPATKVTKPESIRRRPILWEPKQSLTPFLWVGGGYAVGLFFNGGGKCPVFPKFSKTFRPAAGVNFF